MELNVARSSTYKLLFLLVFLPFIATAETSLTPYYAEYKVKVLVISGKLFTEFRQTDAGYVARSTIKPSGIARLFLRGEVVESAWFETSDTGVIPTRYSSIDNMIEKQEMEFEFDWENGLANGTVGDVEHSVALDGLVHDRVSIQYELMHDLLNNSEDKHYTLLNEDELRPINVTNIGTKSVKVPFGKFEAVGIQHSNEEGTRVSILWCVEELGYLPVMIEQYRDGKLRVRASLKHYEPIVETTAAE